MKIIRSRAPLRLGLAGGGTDVSPFCDLYGGQTLNATISRYAYCTIIPQNTGDVEISRLDCDDAPEIMEAQSLLEPVGSNVLAKAVYNRIVSDFNRGQPL
ncbi:MAG: dehydrogenase, partial [Planctomycetales bacterium]